jgi:hypothetical protein
MGDSEKFQGRADLAVTAAAVCWYSAFHLLPALMHCCSTAETFVTLGEKTSGSLIAAQQRLMISLLTCTNIQIAEPVRLYFRAFNWGLQRFVKTGCFHQISLVDTVTTGGSVQG